MTHSFLLQIYKNKIDEIHGDNKSSAGYCRYSSQYSTVCTYIPVINGSGNGTVWSPDHLILIFGFHFDIRYFNQVVKSPLLRSIFPGFHLQDLKVQNVTKSGFYCHMVIVPFPFRFIPTFSIPGPTQV